MNTETKETIQQLIFDIPKTEIHLHLEGMCSVDTLWILIERNKLSIEGITTRQDLIEKFVFTSLDEFLWLFMNVIQRCFKYTEDLELLIDDAQKYFLANNVVYSEVFFAPSMFLQNGLSFKDMIQVLTKGAKRLQKDHGIEVKYIIDVSRSFGPENARNNLDLTLENRNDSIIGIGLGGAEAQGPAADYEEVFSKARQQGLKVVAHAGEVLGPESVWDALTILHAERIGHGISSVYDDSLIEHLKKSRVPLEVCPTSNVSTRKYVTKMEDHPIKKLFDSGVYVTLNTDDPTLFNVTLVEEYMNLYNHLGFSAQDLFTLIKNNIFATSLSRTAKEKLWKNAAAVISKAGYSLS